MSNMSTAQGNVSIAGSSESILSFIKLLAFTENWEHGTMIDQPISANGTQTWFDELQESQEHTEIETTFTGYGRGNYRNNLENLIEYLNEDRYSDDRWSDEEELAWKRLDNHPINAIFTYSDVLETEFIETEKTSIAWKIGNMIDPIVRTTDTQIFEPTAENVKRFTGSDCYDYSTYTVNNLKDEWSIEQWVAELKNSPVNNMIKDSLFKKHYDTIMEKLSQRLDAQRIHQYNSIWYEPYEWLIDEVVIESFEAIFAEITKKGVNV